MAKRSVMAKPVTSGSALDAMPHGPGRREPETGRCD